MIETIEIDGAYGEGGGQILRSSLSLSLITGKPFHIKQIRANRKNPGLANQHLTAIKAAMQISKSQAEGDYLESQELFFFPGKVEPGNYSFSVSTAGSMPLVLHTVYLPLAMADKPSPLSFQGGTHVPWSPCYEYLEYVWGKAMQKTGLNMSFHISQAGYYPQGKGKFEVEVFPTKEIQPWNTDFRSHLLQWNLFSILSGLPEHIAEREFKKVSASIQECSSGIELQNKILSHPAVDRGNVLFLCAEFNNAIAGFTSIGERGKSAEKVAEELLSSFWDFWKSQASLEEHLGDQVLLPLSFSNKESSYRVSNVTNHLITNAYIIGLFCKAKISIEGEIGKPGLIKIQP